jgi:hypothetical protein
MPRERTGGRRAFAAQREKGIRDRCRERGSGRLMVG